MNKRILNLVVIIPLLMVLLIGKAFALVPLLALGGAFLEADAVATAGAAASVAIAEAATGTSAGAIAAGAASSTVVDAVATGIATTVGMALTYLAVKDSAGNAVRVPLVADANKGKIPAPAAAGTTSPTGVWNIQIGAGSQAQANNCSGGNMQPIYHTPEQACQVLTCFFITNGYTGATYTVTYPVNPQNAVCKSYTGASLINTSSWSQVIACPAGYTVSGSSCALSDARAVTADHNLDYGRSGNVYSAPSSTDADAATSPIKGSIGASSDVQIVGTDAKGRTVLYDVVPRTDGGSTVKIQTSVSDTSGNTGLRTQTIQVSPTAFVESATQTTTAQSLSVNTTAGAGAASATVLAADAGATAPQTQPQSITFPSDYARMGEAAAAAQTVKTSVDALSPRLDTLHHDLTDASTPPTDPTLPASTQFDNAFFKDTFTNLLAWRLPGHTSTCPVVNFDYTLFGAPTHLVMDGHCTLAEQQRANLSVAMIVFWTLVALFIVMEA